MRYFLVYSQEETLTQTGASTAAEIQGALNAAIGQQNACGVTIGGSWVGSPRITRQANLSLSTGRTTHVAWLFQYPESPVTESTVQQCIKAVVDLQLALLGDWQPSQILSYNPATNGSVDWWASGQAAATHTQNAFDLNQQFGGTSTIENPTGPQLATPPGNLTPPGLPSLDSIKTVAWIVGGAIALYYVWPVLSGTRGAIVRSQKRSATRRRLAERGSRY
jgi:hypothetical protein